MAKTPKNVKNAFKKTAGPDYADAAQRLLDAVASSGKAIETAQSEFERACVVARQSAIENIRIVASEFTGMSAADFDAHIKPPMLATLERQGMKAPAPHIAKIKVAFLAFAHGIEPEGEKAKANLQHFVNDEARGKLQEAGILEASTKGRTKGTTSEKTKDQRQLAALLLAGDASLDRATVKRRAAMLNWATRPAQWKLLERNLEAMAKTLKVSFDD
jgi:hypothetical protein